MLIIALLTLAACGELGTQRPTRLGSGGDPPASPAADAQGAPAEWTEVAAGVSVRRVKVARAAPLPSFPVVLVRLDPALVMLRVVHASEKPLTFGDWVARERPLLAINGGYFEQGYAPTALLISDGASYGQSYDGFGGLFGADGAGNLQLRALADAPYAADEGLTQAVESSPMLVLPGGVVASGLDDGRGARRTAVAIDGDGRVLFIVAPTSAFTLRGLAAWLAASDLGVDRALNLDGGSSTALYLDGGGVRERIDPFGPLPFIITINPRQ